MTQTPVGKINSELEEVEMGREALGRGKRFVAVSLDEAGTNWPIGSPTPDGKLNADTEEVEMEERALGEGLLSESTPIGLEESPSMVPAPSTASNEDLSLAELLPRVEAATGPDRELFADVAVCLLPGIFGRLQRLEINSPEWSCRNRVGDLLNAEAWTDAALALLEWALPGWRYAVDASAPEMGIDVDLFSPRRMNQSDDVRGTGNTFALAILAALLNAFPGDCALCKRARSRDMIAHEPTRPDHLCADRPFHARGRRID